MNNGKHLLAEITHAPNSLISLFRRRLWFRFAGGVLIPILVIMVGLSLLHYWRARQLLDEQVRLMAMQLGEVMRGSLYHAMLLDDREMIAEILADVGQMENILQIQLVDLSGQVKMHSDQNRVGTQHRIEEAGCQECHRFPPESRPHTTHLAVSPDILRIATPIDNEPACQSCHATSAPHLGVLLADVSFTNIQHRLQREMGREILMTVGITLALTLAVLTIHLLVARRRLVFREPLARLAAGDFSVRVSVPWSPVDDLDKVAQIFNLLASELERREREQQERQAVREQAIAEERERIARELHDGLGQLLGFVNTKAMAARLMLKKRELDGADQHLYQLEEAARELFTDVREAILNLRTASPCPDKLEKRLALFTDQFSRLAEMPIELDIGPEIEALGLDDWVEMHLFRIIQEALNNVRKHASANRAWVHLHVTDGMLELTIGDDGKGFAPEQAAPNGFSGFGLQTMRERAAEIGATFTLDSEPGKGCRITVRLPVASPPRGEEEK